METISNYFNEYAIKNNEQHHIAKLFYELRLQCEKIPAHIEQTNTLKSIDVLEQAIMKQLQRSETFKKTIESVFKLIDLGMTTKNVEVMQKLTEGLEEISKKHVIKG